MNELEKAACAGITAVAIAGPVATEPPNVPAAIPPIPVVQAQADERHRIIDAPEHELRYLQQTASVTPMHGLAGSSATWGANQAADDESWVQTAIQAAKRARFASAFLFRRPQLQEQLALPFA